MCFKYKVSNVMERSESGAVSLEAAFVLPLLLTVLLLFVSVLQGIVLRNCVERATLQTAKTLSQYAVVYHSYGMVKLEEKVLQDLDGVQQADFIDLRGYVQSGENRLYGAAAERFIQYYLQQEPLVRNGYVRYEDISCDGSTFFAGNDDILLDVSCKADYPLSVGTTLRVRGWVRGDSPLSSLIQEGVSVWSFDNFTRGKMIRDIFGGDLPYDYPVIASFQDGVALMIKSVDTTKSTYQDTERLKQEIRAMIEKLQAFQGVPGEIEADAIKSKKLLLVVPENTQPEQANALFESVRNYGVVHQIQVEIQFYQESCNSKEPVI